jgi:hypothetical protein
MLRLAHSRLGALAVVTVMLSAAPALAQNARSFVSGLGNDTNPCSLTAPCRTFAYALTQTEAGGEIVVLDSAGYGPMTITQSVSIVNPGGVEAGIAVPHGGTGIVINAINPPGTITLSGLTLEGSGIGSTGIAFNLGAELEIFGVVVRDFVSDGIAVNPAQAGSASIVISNSSVTDNGTGINILISGTQTITLNHDVVDDNSTGISVATQGPAPLEMLINNSNIDNNSTTGLSLQGSAASDPVNVVLENSTMNQTPTDISVNGFVNLWLSHVTQAAVPGFTNSGGLVFNGGSNNVYSDGTNHLNNNLFLQTWSFQ